MAHLVIVMSRCRTILRSVESTGIDLLWIRRVGVGRLLLRVDWHQILQIELFFLLPLASKANGGAGQKNRGNKFAGDGSPGDDVRPIIGDASILTQDLK